MSTTIGPGIDQQFAPEKFDETILTKGNNFLCPCAGAISLMPGTSSNPAYRRVDVDVNTAKVSGLF